MLKIINQLNKSHSIRNRLIFWIKLHKFCKDWIKLYEFCEACNKYYLKDVKLYLIYFL